MFRRCFAVRFRGIGAENRSEADGKGLTGSKIACFPAAGHKRFDPGGVLSPGLLSDWSSANLMRERAGRGAKASETWRAVSSGAGSRDSLECQAAHEVSPGAGPVRSGELSRIGKRSDPAWLLRPDGKNAEGRRRFGRSEAEPRRGEAAGGAAESIAEVADGSQSARVRLLS